MTFKERLNYIKNRLFKKNNMILLIILSIIITIIISCFSIMNYIIIYKQDSYNSRLGRTLIVYNSLKEQNQIKSIEHVEIALNSKYLISFYPSTNEYNSVLLASKLEIRPLLNKNYVNIKKGKNLSRAGEIICPVNFYPHSEFENPKSSKKVLYKSLMINGKKEIGKTLSFNSENPDYLNQVFKFRIVGAYKNNKIEPMNICYVSTSDFDQLVSNYYPVDSRIDENGNVISNQGEYKDLMVIVDKYQNISTVMKELEEKGYASEPIMTLDESFLNYLIYIPMFIAIITIIICFAIIYSFLRKKNYHNQKKYGILKSLGYTNNMIYKIEILENILIFIISSLIAIIIYSIISYLLQNTILVEFIYNNYTVKVPWCYLILFFILFAILIIKSEKYLLKISLKNSIKELLKS